MPESNNIETMIEAPQNAHQRPNMADRQSEHWRPPLHAPMRTTPEKMAASLRRFFDLQAGSAWPDLKTEIGAVTGTMLDVGCGAQPYRSLLSPGAVYIGLDTADAEDHFGYKMPDTVYFSGTAWPLPDSSIDFILCTETLEHVLKPETLLNEAYRCLRPGGRMLITVPFAARWHFVPHDYWRYTPASLKHLLNEAHFKDVGIYARGNALTVACYKVMALFIPLLLKPISNLAVKALYRLAGLLFTPLLLVLAIIANLSLLLPGGDDCLGYTVLTTRRD